VSHGRRLRGSTVAPPVGVPAQVHSRTAGPAEGTELPHGRHYRILGRRYCRNVWRKVVVSVLVLVALAVVWVWPGFSEPPHAQPTAVNGTGDMTRWADAGLAEITG
jgi:hypothetical protein